MAINVFYFCIPVPSLLPFGSILGRKSHSLISLVFPLTGPPSAPRNVISNINETSVILDWSWPLDTGGRKDVTFNIICKKCSGGSRACEPCSDNVRFLPRQSGLTNTTVTVVDLLAHTNYTFEIDALNGVSELSTLARQFAAVSITTNQAGESLPAPPPLLKGFAWMGSVVPSPDGQDLLCWGLLCADLNIAVAVGAYRQTHDISGG